MRPEPTAPAYATVDLTRFQFAVENVVTSEYARFAIIPRFEEDEDWPRGLLRSRLTQEIFGRQVECVEARWPADWKEALKERFLPAWLKRCWPVRYRTLTVDVKALWPGVPDVPQQACRLHVAAYRDGARIEPAAPTADELREMEARYPGVGF